MAWGRRSPTQLNTPPGFIAPPVPPLAPSPPSTSSAPIHLSSAPIQPTLEGRTFTEEEVAKHSVWDEPAIAGGATVAPQPRMTLGDTATCGACGYNVRGLTTQDHCPECGGLLFAWQASRWALSQRLIAERSSEAAWLSALWLGLLGGLCSVLSPCLMGASTALPALFIQALITEFGKVLPLAWALEQWPHTVKTRSQVLASALVAGLACGMVVVVVRASLGGWVGFRPDAGAQVSVLAAHGLLGVVGGLGVARMRDRGLVQARAPHSLDAAGWVSLAAALHVAWGLAALLANAPTLSP